MKPIVRTLVPVGLLLLLAAAVAPSAEAQQYRFVRIQETYGETQLAVGQAGYYRARLRFGAAVPIEYTWDFGDRTTGQGNGIAHRYERPGRYLVRVTARNQHGSDTDSLFVTVAPGTPAAADEPAEAVHASTAAPHDAPTTAVRAVDTPATRAATRPSADHLFSFMPPRSGYTWVVGTYLHREAAETAMLGYRNKGYRTGIHVDTKGAGSTAYRVIIGQFTTPNLALYARSRLPADTLVGTWLLELTEE